MGEDADAPGRALEAERQPGPPEELDLRGEVCPYTFLKARLALDALAAGALLRVVVDNEASARDVPRSLAGAGHAVLRCVAGDDGTCAILVRRGPR
jgi:TusA-related sulfurtransferase